MYPFYIYLEAILMHFLLKICQSWKLPPESGKWCHASWSVQSRFFDHSLGRAYTYVCIYIYIWYIYIYDIYIYDIYIWYIYIYIWYIYIYNMYIYIYIYPPQRKRGLEAYKVSVLFGRYYVGNRSLLGHCWCTYNTDTSMNHQLSHEKKNSYLPYTGCLIGVLIMGLL